MNFDQFGPPLWVCMNSNALVRTNTLAFDNRVSFADAFYLRKGDAAIDHTIHFGGSPPLIIGEGTRTLEKDVCEGIRTFVKELVLTEGVSQILISAFEISINGSLHSEVILTDPVRHRIDDLIQDTWNLVTVGRAEFDSLQEIMNREDWPDLIG